MNSYADVDGVPAGADPWLLTEVLRDEWGFAGTVVSDYWAVPFLATMHRVAADAGGRGRAGARRRHRRRAARHASASAGLVERVRRGSCRRSWSTGPRARLLTQKVELGLLDPDWTPEGSVADAAGVDLDSPANRALARELAERSIVLLDAGTALPLLGDGRPRCAGWRSSGRAPTTRARSWAATPSPTTCCPAHPGLGLGIEVPHRASTRCAPSCPTSRSSTRRAAP